MYEHQYFYLFLILQAKGILLVAFFCLGFSHWIYMHFFGWRHKRTQRALAGQIVSGVPFRLRHSVQDLIIALESLQHQPEHMQKYVLPKARKWASSDSWERRAFAARGFALFPRKEDEPYIVHLLADPKFIISGRVGIAAIKIQSVIGMREILKHCSKNNTFLLSYYSHLFASAPTEIHDLLVEIGKNSGMQTTALKLLYARKVA